MMKLPSGKDKTVCARRGMMKSTTTENLSNLPVVMTGELLLRLWLITILDIPKKKSKPT
jgi:hypothetical protein